MPNEQRKTQETANSYVCMNGESTTNLENCPSVIAAKFAASASEYQIVEALVKIGERDTSPRPHPKNSPLLTYAAMTPSEHTAHVLGVKPPGKSTMEKLSCSM